MYYPNVFGNKLNQKYDPSYYLILLSFTKPNFDAVILYEPQKQTRTVEGSIAV